MKGARVLLVVLFALGVSYGQQPAPAKRSHVERFSSPEARASKVEQEATEKLRKDPNNPEAVNDRALARLRLQKFAEAYDDLQRAVQLDPGNADYRANLGYVLWKLARSAEAIQAEREALKIDPRNYTANYQLGRFLLRTGDKDLIKEAAEKLRKALEIDPRQYEVRFELIAAFRELGDTAAALGQLDLLQDAKPSDARVFYVAGLLNADRGDLKSAIADFGEAIRLDPNLYGAWQDLGLAYVKQGRWADAVNAFAELAKRQQNSVEVAYLLSVALYNSNRIAEAESEVRRALRLNTGFAQAHTLLGIILLSKENGIVEALEALMQAVALAPEDFDARLHLGRAQYLSRDYSKALENLEVAVSASPNNIQVRFFLGTVLEALGQAEKALPHYQEIVHLDERSFYGQVGLGALLLKQGKLDEAIQALKQAVSIRPDSFEANWALGRAYILQEDFAEAEAVLQNAVNLQPTRTDARYQWAIALRRNGRLDEARREFDLVDKLNKEFREAKQP